MGIREGDLNGDSGKWEQMGKEPDLSELRDLVNLLPPNSAVTGKQQPARV